MGRITTQDIADSLGISRGTVSKALNGRAKIDQHTKDLVQKTADKMGYKRLALEKIETIMEARTLTIIIQDSLYSDPYWSSFIKSFGLEASKKNFKYNIAMIDPELEARLLLPREFSPDPPGGIVTIGPISEGYYRLLQGTGIPAVFVDTAVGVDDAYIFGDTLLMCNQEHVYEMTQHLILKGHKKLGFVSAHLNCRSLYERWKGFTGALGAHDIPIEPKFIYGTAPEESAEGIRPWVTSLDEFPTAFVCANDFFAMTVKSTLSDLGMDVPRDIALCGYDADQRLSSLYAELTTVDSRPEYMGERALRQLYWRLESPNAPYEVVKITSSVSYKNSTEGYVFR